MHVMNKDMLKLNKRFIKRYWPYAVLIVTACIILLYLKGTQVQPAGVVLNEVCSSNFRTVSDNEGKYVDWIELYNTSGSSVDLRGYRLSEDEALDSGWTIPETVMEPYGHLVVFAGKNADRKESYNKNLSSSGISLFLASPKGDVIDRVTVPRLKYDTTWARIEDGNNDWTAMTPTPGYDNINGTETELITDETVVFSYESGFYDSPFDLTLKGSNGGEVYYTLDGSAPDKSSTKYTSPIHIEDISDSPDVYAARDDVSPFFEEHYSLPPRPVDKAVTVRAAAFDSEGARGDTITKTYFIGYNDRSSYDHTAVVSVVSDPEGLFSYDNGIYVLGKTFDDNVTDEDMNNDTGNVWWWFPANYRWTGRNAEREASVSFFDENHDLMFTQDLGLRIKGGGTRAFAQKAFNLFARGAYKARYMKEDLFEGYDNEESASLFTGGDDYKLKIKDILIARLMKDRSVSVIDGRPSAVFLDGEYWGGYWIMERYDDRYFAEKYGVDPDNVIMIKNDDLVIGNAEDRHFYDDMNSLTFGSDMSDEAAYQELCSYLDMDSVMDYFGAMAYIARTDDWPGANIGLWRVREPGNGEYEDGKWRFCILDVNSDSMEPYDVNTDSMTYASDMSYLLKSLMQNPGFRKDFEENFRELSEEVFASDRVCSEIDSIASSIRPQMETTYERYYSGILDISDFDEGVKGLKGFYKDRYKYIIKDVENCCRAE